MKKVGIVKRLFCLLLIFLLSINSFAAIVSDNDGSAFITKAEFDALKSSFQSQIDTYNQSIDSKIDGAIASYLSGIKLSTEETLSTILPINEKIKMIRDANEVVYKRGLMKDNGLLGVWFRGFTTSTDSYRKWSLCVNLTFHLKTSSNVNDYNYNKIYIENIDYIKKIGAFNSYRVSENEKLKVFAFITMASGFQDLSETVKQKPYWISYTGTTWKTTNHVYDGTDAFINEVYCVPNKDNKSSHSGIFTGTTEYGVSKFDRVYGDIVLKYVLIPESIAYKRFTDFDTQAYNFSNDDEINDTNNRSNDVFDSCTAQVRQMLGTNTDAVNYTQEMINNTGMADWGKVFPPYEGFANTTLTNWNQIYNSAFDVVASTYSSGVTTDSKGVKHLMSYAGLPIASLKKEQRLEYELKFEDTTKEYDVWVKLSPFGDKTQDSETGLETKITAKRGNTTISLGANKYLTVKSGDILVVDNAEKEGYVFIKWREKGDTSYGGGTLISTGEAKIIKQG